MWQRFLVPMFLLGVLAGCDDPSDVDGDLSAEETADLANAMADDAFTGTDGALAGGDVAGSASLVMAAPVTTTAEFTITRTCPAGGNVVMEGTRERTYDSETQAGEVDLDLTRTANDCARTVRGRTITIDGNPNIAVLVHREFANGGPTGVHTMSLEGAFTWSSDDGRSGECTIDLDITWTIETQTRTAIGTVCGREINSSVTRSSS